MNAVASVPDRLPEALRAIRDYFQTGGSDWLTLLVLFVIAAMVALAFVLTLRQRRAQEPHLAANPRRLFYDLLRKLDLPVRQRQFVDAVARDLHVASPATMLLSPAVFDRCIAEWQSRKAPSPAKTAPADTQPDAIAKVRASLFPNR